MITLTVMEVYEVVSSFVVYSDKKMFVDDHFEEDH
jgi:hypothetical protein